MRVFAVPRSIERSLEKNLPKPNMKRLIPCEKGGSKDRRTTTRKARQCSNRHGAKQGKMPLRALSQLDRLGRKNGADEAVRRFRCDKVVLPLSLSVTHVHRPRHGAPHRPPRAAFRRRYGHGKRG